MTDLGMRDIVVSGLCPSGRKKKTTTKIIMAITASVTKTKRQFDAATIKLPTVGANNGDAPNINISKEMILELLSAGKKSSTIAIAATDATHPLRAWIKRISHNISIELDKAHPIVAAT